MDGSLELTVLLPARDEGAHLAQVLTDVRAAAARLTGSFEILVVDGGSRDQTVSAAETAGARVLRQRGRGYGQAVREGLDAARGRWVLAMDADGSHPVRYFADLWERRGDCELVIASRFVPGGAARMSWYRYGLSRLLNAVTRRVLDWTIHDSSSGLRLYRREAAAGLPLRAEDFSVQQEVLAHILGRGGRAVEVPFLYEPRLSGESKADVALLARRYLAMLARLRGMRGGWAGPAALVAALALGLIAGLMGISWGLPGPQRWRAFPEAMRRDPESARRLKESWQRLYEGIEKTHREVKGEEPVTRVQGVEEIRPGWNWPPDKLVNSYRSLLMRSENPDEQKLFVMLSRMRPWRMEFQPLYLHYGGGFIYPLGVFLAAAKLLGAAMLVPDLAHYLLHPEDMARLYLLGRLFVLLFQLGALWVLYDLGRRLSGPLTGFCAAAFYTLMPLFVGQSHTGKPHPYSAFWALAAARGLFLAFESGARRQYVFAGLCLGMAAGANSSFACLAFLPLLVWLLRRQERPGGWRDALLAMAAAGGVYAATNPYVFIATRDYLWETTVYPGSVRDFSGNLASLLGPWSWAGLGPGLYLACAAGFFVALLRPDPKRRMLALSLACGFGVLWLFLAKFWGFLSPSGLRFFMPFYALAGLLAADCVCSLRNRWVKTLILMLVFVDCGLRSWVYLRNFQLDAGPRSTREQAADWIEANIPAGATVGLPRYPQPAHTPPFRYDRHRLLIFEKPELLKPAQRPEFLVTDAANRAVLGSLTGAGGYQLIQGFQSYRAGWADVQDDDFPNAGFFIYQKQKPPR
ncbi:MAG: glycosyltransferase [Elusimicrobia bacterium]|nr:glycosyltransferase [Elusimicrobiota bacterium]